MENIYLKLKQLIDLKTPCTLATVVSATGSAPQVPGSSAIFGREGLIAGTIGGGPAEYQVMLKALASLETGRSELISFDLAGNVSFQSDSICGGTMTILLDAQPHIHLTEFIRMTESISHYRKGILFSLIEENLDKTLDIRRFWITDGDISGLPDELHEIAAMAIQGMSSDITPLPCRFLQVPLPVTAEKSVWFFLQPVSPPPSLVIAGAGHVGKALARIAKFLGYDVTVWDDRNDFANAVNIPFADQHFSGPFEQFTRQITIDSNTWLVIVTRGHQFDATVLKSWIKTRPAYLGMMGSRSKVAQLRHQFLEQGWATEEEWNRVHTPVGLKIGAKTVEEIAVSIAAELIQVKYGQS